MSPDRCCVVMEITPALLTVIVPRSVPRRCTTTVGTVPLSLGPLAGFTVAEPFAVMAAGLL